MGRNLKGEHPMARIEPRRHTVIRHNRAYIVDLWPNGTCNVYDKPVNPITGQPWQASRNLQHFEGDRAVTQAMMAWMQAVRATE
jgi:hypothetical protein